MQPTLSELCCTAAANGRLSSKLRTLPISTIKLRQKSNVRMRWSESPPSSGPKKDPSKSQTTMKLSCPVKTHSTFCRWGGPVRNPPAELDCDHMLTTQQASVFYTELFPLEVTTLDVREGRSKMLLFSQTSYNGAVPRNLRHYQSSYS